MGYTKLDLIKGALTEIGLSDYMFDLSADQLDQALTRLDLMMAEWGGRGIRLGYPLATSPSDIDAMVDAGIPDWARMAVITNLAIQLAPSFGKTVSRETSISATRGMNTLFSRSAKPSQARLGQLPVGAGMKSSAPFMSDMDDGVVHNPDESVTLDRSPR
jgi:P22 tail accessory factor.